MVSSLYIFVGQDKLSKDIRLKELKQESFPKEVEKFNFDILYAQELDLLTLQERLLCLPVKAKRRLILIRGAEHLKPELKEFIIKFSRSPSGSIALLLDIDSAAADKSGLSPREPNDNFINRLIRYAQVFRFKETKAPDTFSLSRQINLRRPAYALRLLNQLLKNGQKPEWIIGALRYSLEKDSFVSAERKKRLKWLLDCDVDIKTGRLRAPFALERLIIRLCCLR